MRYFQDSLSFAVTLCAFVAVVVVVIVVRRHRAGLAWGAAVRDLIRPAGLTMSVMVILAMTVYTPYWAEVLESWRSEDGRYFNGNLIPFRTITSYVTSTPSFSVAVQLFGNVLLFVPLGFFLAFDSKHRTRTVVAIGLAAALLVEVLQFLVGRAVDVDDVILNLVGALLGVGAAASVRLMGRPGTRPTAV